MCIRDRDNIPLASALHDIGKIGIDEAILNKPGKLTAEEFAVIKTHSMPVSYTHLTGLGAGRICGKVQ